MTQYILGGTLILGGGYWYFNNSNKDLYPYLTKIIGYSTIYYNKIYDKYIKTNNIKILNIILNGKKYNTLELSDIKKFTFLEMEYQQLNKIYSIVNFDNDLINFPIYSNKELENLSSFSITDESIIIASLIDKSSGKELEIVDESFLKLVRKFSGPMGNFYMDKLSNFHENYKIKLRKYIINLYNDTLKQYEISIMYSDGNTLIL